MFKNILVAAAVIGAFTLVSPAFALDGEEALDQCNKTDGCVGQESGEGGPVVIVGPKGGLVTCANKKSKCSVVWHGGSDD